MPKQLDHLAAHGANHHYRLDTALHAMAQHCHENHHGRIAQLRAEVGKMPPQNDVIALAQEALAILRQHGNAEKTPYIAPATYGAIHHELEQAIEQAKKEIS